MKKLIAFIVTLLFAPLLQASNAPAFEEWTQLDTRFVECLGIEVDVLYLGQDLKKEFVDHHGNSHWIRRSRWETQINDPVSGMSWSAKGAGPDTRQFKSNGAGVVTIVRHEIALADGDYPNLLWTFRIELTWNAGGDLVRERWVGYDQDDIRCI
jgi:hypothetical protein